jgi:hypothetical protein
MSRKKVWSSRSKCRCNNKIVHLKIKKMSQAVTNRKASQSLKGTAVLVTLDSTDSAYLADFSEGMLCTVSSSSETGTINRVDSEGHSFSVTPIQPDKYFQSAPSTYGYLAVGETVTVTF